MSVRFVRRVAALLAMLGLVTAPLQALQDCTMPPFPGVNDAHHGAIDPMAHAHHVPDEGATHSGAIAEGVTRHRPPVLPDVERCPDLRGCSPAVAPAPVNAERDPVTHAPSAPTARASAWRSGPVTALEPPPPRR